MIKYISEEFPLFFMEFKDINDKKIQPGFYLETFYKGKDEFRNRIVCIMQFDKQSDFYSVTSQVRPSKLNPRYSRWLKPLEEEIPLLETKL